MYYIIGIAVVMAVLVVLYIKADNLKSVKKVSAVEKIKISIDKESVYKKLSKAIQVKTISHSNPEKIDYEEFVRFQKMLKQQFPKAHSILKLEVVNNYSLLYKWEGYNQNLKPGLFMAHMDVVPIETGTESEWDHPPFNGDVADGFLWGRGSMDIKIQLITMLEACENLIEKGFRPERTLYFAFGHDEETDGKNGALKIAEKLKNENIELQFVNDEGGCINRGNIKSVKSPIAFIGIAEKGFLNLQVKITGKGGHSSTPPEHSTLGIAARAICRLENKKMKIRLTDVTRKIIKDLGSHMGLTYRIVIANFWLLRPLFIRLFTSPGTTGEALLRTTITPTMAHGSMEPNVLPQITTFTVNCRILHGETYQDVISHVKKACKGMDYEIKVLRHEEPSAISPDDSEIYNKMAAVIKGIQPDTIVIPYLMVSGTDSIKYEPICKNILRFTPYTLDMHDMKRIHGTNERISLKNIDDCTRFYMALFSEL